MKAEEKTDETNYLSNTICHTLNPIKCGRHARQTREEMNVLYRCPIACYAFRGVFHNLFNTFRHN